MGTKNLDRALELMGRTKLGSFGSLGETDDAYTIWKGAQEELIALKAALAPFAKFSRVYGPVARALDYAADRVLMEVGTADGPVVVRLSDLYTALKALGEEP